MPNTRILYRCEFGATRSIPTDLDHPRTVYVREDAIAPMLDAWLAEIVTPDALATAQTPPPDAEARDTATRATMADCDLRIERLTASVEQAGMPVEWIANRVVKLRAERDRLEQTLPDRSSWRPLSPGEINAIADALGGLITILQNASPQDRFAVYQQLGGPTRTKAHAKFGSVFPPHAVWIHPPIGEVSQMTLPERARARAVDQAAPSSPRPPPPHDSRTFLV